MPDHTHDPRTPAGRAALRKDARGRGDCDMIGQDLLDAIPVLLDLADERDRLAALLGEAREAVAQHDPYAHVLAHIDAALAKEPRP